LLNAMPSFQGLPDLQFAELDAHNY
jgi:hypothetical protein